MDKHYNRQQKSLVFFSMVFYLAVFVALAVCTVFDLDIAKAVFDPQSSFAILTEAFGQIVYWGMWGPLFTVLFLTRFDLAEATAAFKKIFPFLPEYKNKDSALFKTFNKAFVILSGALFYILAVIGWKKLIQNVCNDFFDLPEYVYFIISAAAAVIAIFVFKRIDKKTLYELKALAIAGLCLGLLYKAAEECKELTGRVRFREMVAYSNGITDENGKSLGVLDKLTSQLTSNMKFSTDFSSFTRWFEKGSSKGIYNKANSFPSGHTTYACTLFMSSLAARSFEKTRKYAPLFFVFSFLYVCMVGYSRMIAGAHYLSDVVAGLAVGYTCFIFIFFLFEKLRRKNVPPFAVQ